MSAPLITTKLYIPATRADAVPRPRLIELLEQGLGRKLTLIAAPAGFGKTTLIADWIANCKLQIADYDQSNSNLQSTIYNLQSIKAAWLSLDDDDNDPVRFLTYLIAAVRTIDPAIGQTALAFLGAPQLPSFTTLLTLLINDLASLPD